MTRKPEIKNYVLPVRWSVGALGALVVIVVSMVTFYFTQVGKWKQKMDDTNQRVTESMRISAENNSILKQMQVDTRTNLKDIEDRQRLTDIRLTTMEIVLGIKEVPVKK